MESSSKQIKNQISNCKIAESRLCRDGYSKVFRYTNHAMRATNLFDRRREPSTNWQNLKKRTQFAGLSCSGNGLRRDEWPEAQNSKLETCPE